MTNLDHAGQATAEPTSSACKVVHCSFGRLRVHLIRWPRWRIEDLTTRLGDFEGVHRVETNSFTQNVLLLFEPRRTSAPALLRSLNTALTSNWVKPAAQGSEEPSPKVKPHKEELRQETIP